MVQKLKTSARRHLWDRQTDANNSGADGERKMANFQGRTIRTRDDLERFESEMTLDERLPERSILDVFEASAALYPTSTAITMLMTGAEDEQPRQVNYDQLLGMIHSAANVFSLWAVPHRAWPICCRP
jgi:hypothetical protein